MSPRDGHGPAEMGRKRTAVQQLIAAYRVGARWADLDPLKRAERDKIPELELSFYASMTPTRNGVQHQQHLLRQESMACVSWERTA